MRIKMSEWAAQHGVHYRTAKRWVREGTFPAKIERTPGGHLRVIEAVADEAVADEAVVIYARVSSSDQKADLARQGERMVAYARAKGLRVQSVVPEIGSGLNGHRKGLARILGDAGARVILVEHRDRLARFGVEYIDAALAATGRRLIVADETEHKSDLVQEIGRAS